MHLLTVFRAKVWFKYLGVHLVTKNYLLCTVSELANWPIDLDLL